MEKIDFTVFSTPELALEISQTAAVLAQLVLGEIQLQAVIDAVKKIAGDHQQVISAQAELDQIICHRREGIALVIEMTEEFNSRPDRPRDLPVPDVIRNLSVQS